MGPDYDAPHLIKINLMGAALRDPLLHVLGEPHLAGLQRGGRRGEAGAAGDLVDPLAADTAEADPDLVSTHEADRLCHARDYSDTTSQGQVEGVSDTRDAFVDLDLTIFRKRSFVDDWPLPRIAPAPHFRADFENSSLRRRGLCVVSLFRV